MQTTGQIALCACLSIAAPSVWFYIKKISIGVLMYVIYNHSIGACE